MNNKDLAEFNKKRKLVQVGYASDDVWRTIRSFRDILDIAPWEVCSVSDKNSKHVKLYEKRIQEPFDFYCAHCQIGNMDFEVLSPKYGPNAYSQFIAERGSGIQHPKEKVSKEDLWDITLDAESSGAKVMLTGGVDIDRFVYLDMLDQGGAVYELGNQPDMELVSVKWPNADMLDVQAANADRRITQIGYIANDLQRVMETLYNALKMGPWRIATINEKNTSEFKLNGKPVEEPFECRVAVCQIGDIQVEILQPISGLDPLAAYLLKHGEVVHHVKERISPDKQQEFVDRMRSKGYEACISGKIGGESFVCYDLDKSGLSAYMIGGPTGYLSFEGIETTVWPEEFDAKNTN